MVVLIVVRSANYVGSILARFESASVMSPTSKTTCIKLFGCKIDVLDMKQAVRRVQGWVVGGEERCHIVVTPNVDHVVMMQTNQDLRQVYASADMVLADGWPVVAASRLLRKPLPERVAGSDLVPCLFKHTKTDGPLSVYLLGAAEGVADRAAMIISDRWPSVTVVGTYSPPLGFERDAAENNAILARIAAARPDVLVVGLGAPKQDLWVHRHRDRIQARAALCVGATIDFLAGERNRAPRWVRRIGCEWLYRMMSERRLVKRYVRDAWIFPQLFWREWSLRG
jgi:N-acetylglucosaminyldiphosphoundecaprenol N-acetyl-beta-D-mannosaminyltransferase